MSSTVPRASVREDTSARNAVIRAVAEAEGVEPAELEPRLYDVVDPEALDRLVEPRGRSGTVDRISFTMAGYEVVVEPDEVTVTPQRRG